MLPAATLVSAHGVEPTCMSLHWQVVEWVSHEFPITRPNVPMALALTLRDPLVDLDGAMTRPVLHVCTLLPTRRGMVTYAVVR